MCVCGGGVMNVCVWWGGYECVLVLFSGTAGGGSV